MQAGASSKHQISSSSSSRIPRPGNHTFGACSLFQDGPVLAKVPPRTESAGRATQKHQMGKHPEQGKHDCSREAAAAAMTCFRCPFSVPVLRAPAACSHSPPPVTTPIRTPVGHALYFSQAASFDRPGPPRLVRRNIVSVLQSSRANSRQPGQDCPAQINKAF